MQLLSLSVARGFSSNFLSIRIGGPDRSLFLTHWSKIMFVKEVSVSFYRVCSVCKSKNMFVKEVSVSYYRVCSVCKSRFPVTMGKRSTLHGSSTTSACALLLVCLSLKGMNPKVGTGFDQCHPRGMNPKVGTGFNQCRGCLPQRRPPSIFAV